MAEKFNRGGIPMKSKKRYTVSDGKLVLYLEPAEEGGYNVTSPMDPEVITQAETVEEAFANAYDAAKALKQARTKRLRKLMAAAQR
jgi:predicted RNase H-like HicB family nuclease